jgi:LmbE family N-acetylglucosaminyl deacetylase
MSPTTSGRRSVAPAAPPTLPPLRAALVVVAHPDDETFGLGAVVARIVDEGACVRVLCFTHGEASTLGEGADLARTRARELSCAAAALGVQDVTLLDHADGTLASLPPAELEYAVEHHLGDAEALVVFEPGGVTGHPDHRAATRAALAVATRRELPVLQWGVAPPVAAALNAELGTSFVAFDGEDVVVDRRRQRRAISCHRSQDNPVLRRRLQLQGPVDRVRLDHPGRDVRP